MLTATRERSQPATSRVDGDGGDPPVTTVSIVVYGDFSCPWSYLAARRCEVLEAHGVGVDWRAVEPAAARRTRAADPTTRADELRAQLGLISRRLLPAEPYPHRLPPVSWGTGPAVAGYATAAAAGLGRAARRILFVGYWVDGISLDDPLAVRTLLSPLLRGSGSASFPVEEWGYAVTRTGAPMTSDGHRLLQRWLTGWQHLDKQVSPAVLTGSTVEYAETALDRLATELAARHLTADEEPIPWKPTPRGNSEDVVDRSWVSMTGGRWLRVSQTDPGHGSLAHAGLMEPRPRFSPKAW